MVRFDYLCLILCVGWQYAAGSPVTVTEYEYVREAGAWLRLRIVPATWSDAAVLCQLDGGVLASPTTRPMTQAMLDMIKGHRLAYDSVFIGATNLLSKGTDFESLDGLSLPDDLEWAESDADYDSNPYDGNTSVRCLAMTSGGKLADVRCSQVLPYFCHKSAHNCTSTEEATKSPDSYFSYNVINDGAENSTPDSYYSYNLINDDAENSTPAAEQCEGNGYEWEPRTGSCYKFHRAAETWRQALSTCHVEGGHLAIINGRTESTVLKELFEQNNYTVITGTRMPYYASIGFRKWDGGEWSTINGETLAEAGFEEWSPGEPNALGGNENCGTMYGDGLLNDAPCDALYPYICEKTPNDTYIPWSFYETDGK